MNETILVVDDNEDIRFFVHNALEADGLKVIEAENGDQAIAAFESHKPDLIILDLSIGHPDGFEVCRTIRRNSIVPIIMLTSRDEEMDEAMCLAVGADDYITKPVSGRILTLRVSTQLRHRAIQATRVSNTITAGPLSLNTETRELTVNENVCSLTKTEYDFLYLLIENPKRIFTREQIAEAIDTSLEFSNDHQLDTHASRLRMKIKNTGGVRVLHSVRGVGYRLLSN